MDDREKQWAAWMRAAVSGDEAAYRRLLDALVPMLRGIARRGCARAGAGAGDVEDVVQETLLAIHMKRHTWDSAAPLGPWVAAIARYKLADSLRRRGRRAEVAIDLVADALPAHDTDTGATRHDAERMLRHLDGRSHAVVRAISLDGATTAEAASRLGMTEGAVRVALHRGLKTLAARFRKDHG